MPSLPNCAPDGTHINRDVSEIVQWPEGHTFTPEDAAKPRGGPPVDHLVDPEAARETAVHQVALDALKQGKYGEMGMFYRIPREFYKDVQKDTGIPVYNFYLAVEDARVEMEKMRAHLIADLRDIGYRTNYKDRQRGFMHWEASKQGSNLGAEMKDVVTQGQADLADMIFTRYGKWLVEEAKYTPEEVEKYFAELPDLRTHQGDVKKFFTTRRGISAPMRHSQLMLENGSITYDQREWDPLKVVDRLSIAIANEKHLAPIMKMVGDQIKNLEKEAGVSFPPLLGISFNQYLSQVKHTPDALQIGLARVWGRAIDKLPFGLKQRLNLHENLDIAQRFAAVNYFANMAWNPGFVMRNYLQSLLPVATVGFEDGARGLKIGMKFLRDKALQEHYIENGIITRDIGSQVAREQLDGLSDLQFSGPTGKFFSWMREHGQSWFKTSENFNRVASYEMGRGRAERFGQQYIDGKISWADFIEKSKVDMRDAKDGPFLKMLREQLDQGRLGDAAHRAGMELMYSTQFMYSRGNVPYMMQSTTGRLLGQYGTWPAWFTEHMRGTMLRGSPMNRVKTLSRFVAINAAIYEAGTEVFGVDTGKWTFFSPLGYQGGPLLQIGLHGMAAVQDLVTPGAPDTVQAIQAARLKQDYTQFTPVPWSAVRGIARAADDLGNADVKTAIKHILGFRPVNE